MKHYWDKMSLKVRLTLVMASTGILLVLGCLGGIAYMVFQQYLPTLSQNQQTLLSELADGIDSQLRMSLQALDRVARIASVRTTVDSVAAQRFLENRTGITSLFDNGLALFDQNGRLMAETPANEARTVFDFSNAPFFVQALKADAPIISAPFFSTKPDHHPVIQFCAPIRNGSGVTVGFLTGGLRLDGTNFIGNLANRRIAKTGYLFIYDKERTILAHPDQNRILKQDVPPGVNHLFDKALTGWNGSGVTKNSRGIRMYASFKSLSDVPWIVAANIPASEVFAPVLTGVWILVVPILLLGIGGGVFSRVLIHRLTKPLDDFSRHLQVLPQLVGDERFIQPNGGPEIKTVACGFNQMLSKQDEHLTTIAQQMDDLEKVTIEQRRLSNLLRLVTDNVPDLIWAKDLQHKYLFTNKTNNDTLLFPKTSDEPIGKTHDYFSDQEIAAHPGDPTWYRFSDLCASSDDMTLTSQQVMRFQECGYVRGEQIYLDVYKAPFYDLDDNLIGTIGSARNITREKQLEEDNEKAREEMKLAANVFEQSSEGIVITDKYEKILLVNRAFCEVTGYSPEDVLGETPRLLKSNRHDLAFYQGMWHSLHEFGRWQGELWNRRKNGEIYPEISSISVVRNANGEITNYLAVFSDISSVKASQQQLDYLSWNDPLTDLPNRQMFNLYLTQAVARAQRNNHLVAVLLIDLDYFKDINDSFGHATGDALLVAVARRLRERLRATDQVARLGGDEFGILLEQEQSPESIATVAQSIMTLVRAPFLLDNGVQLHTDLSIGIALAPDHGQTPQELLQRADTALYKAKQQGRAAFAFYSDELTERAVERIQLSNHLRRAVERAELRVLYQPQVDLVSGRITGAEALMRWENPDIGSISPARFIPLAEELGCIVGMGEWILREVCRQGKAWLDAGLSAMSLAVNISSVQFSQASFTQQVAAILAETGYPPELLELELTESGFMQLGEQSVTLLQTLRGLGVRLALDDFGTGYSSLAYLKHFPLHVVKIDKSFIDEIHLGVKDKQLVKAIIFMSKSMNFKVLAEGVELPQQLETLKSLKCDLYQGYLKSRPLSPDAFAELVKNEKTRIQS